MSINKANFLLLTLVILSLGLCCWARPKIPQDAAFNEVTSQEVASPSNSLLEHLTKADGYNPYKMRRSYYASQQLLHGSLIDRLYNLPAPEYPYYPNYQEFFIPPGGANYFNSELLPPMSAYDIFEPENTY